MRNKNHNKRINHNNGLKIAIMLAMTSGIYGSDTARVVNGDGSSNSSRSRSSSADLSAAVINQGRGLPEGGNISGVGDIPLVQGEEPVTWETHLAGVRNSLGGNRVNRNGEDTQPPQSARRGRVNTRWEEHKDREDQSPKENPADQKKPRLRLAPLPSRPSSGRSGSLEPTNLLRTLEKGEALAEQLGNLNRGGASSSHQDPNGASGDLHHTLRLRPGRGSDDLLEGGSTSPSRSSGITVSQAPSERSINLRGVPALSRQGSQSSEEIIEDTPGPVLTNPRSPRSVTSRESTELREDPEGPAGVGAGSSQDPLSQMVPAEVPVTGSPRSFASDDQGLTSRGKVPEGVKTPEKTPRAVQGPTPSTDSRVAPREEDSEEDGTESTVSDLDFDPNALLLEAEGYLAELGINEYAEKYEGIPILDRLMEIICETDFQAEYNKCVLPPAYKMTPEKLVAKIIVSSHSINSVYKSRAFPNTIYSLEEIKEQGWSKTMKLHDTRDLQSAEYLSEMIDMLNKLSLPINQYIDAELPALEEMVDNPDKKAKQHRLGDEESKKSALEECLRNITADSESNQAELRKVTKVGRKLMREHSALLERIKKETAALGSQKPNRNVNGITPHVKDLVGDIVERMRGFADSLKKVNSEADRLNKVITELQGSIAEAVNSINALKGEIGSLPDTTVLMKPQSKQYETKIREILQDIQDLIEQHKTDLALGQKVYGGGASVE